MSRQRLSIGLGSALSAVALTVAPIGASAQSLEQRAEASLARLIKDRIPGSPVACISPFRSERLSVVPYVGVLYRRGDTIYVARVENPRSLGNDDAVVFDTQESELCHNDIGQSVDRMGFSHRVVLGLFVPYTKRN